MCASLWGIATSNRSERRQRMSENILILVDWRLASIIDDTMPPRDPNNDDDEEEARADRVMSREIKRSLPRIAVGDRIPAQNFRS